MYKNRLYIIENKTSLHAGSGDTNLGVIDNKIQRDSITDYPMIHSSSLKGALKEYCTYKHDINEGENFISYIFGDEDHAGKMRFIDAHLLSVPMRSDLNPYYHCVSPKSIGQLLDFADTFGIALKNKEAFVKFANYTGSEIMVGKGTPVIEDEKAIESTQYDFAALEEILGSPLALVPNTIYEELLKDLPVIARNQLENGESKNLFYEEVLPRKSKLFTVISEPQYLNKQDETRLQNAFDRFSDYLTGHDTIHIGANASIGYGICTFKELSDA
ncbi:type III-B CRISPR module RAMP protein Cmr4 [Sulfurovum sp.]|jgi:CRISPR-associated protein Cmr4|uniref:type III-B CRISPR module RAMP protein Cmr4 n=1 Tax=Sulfurovum sp. TaxID=1969726 RepID=UPI002A36BC26|nr:type III-B CRISPR module RAMP protein Cmr4 [Sulfurovum sp.]MDY0403679.1 type III-B CRISPR module RAMP protein Cmr4 [Sulfurovum sp.]